MMSCHVEPYTGNPETSSIIEFDFEELKLLQSVRHRKWGAQHFAGANFGNSLNLCESVNGVLNLFFRAACVDTAIQRLSETP